MNKPGSTRRAKTCNASGRLGIDPGGTLAILLAAIDIRGGRTVHHHVTHPELVSSQTCFGLFGIGKIDIGPGQSHHFDIRKCFPATDKRGAQASIGSKNQNFHAGIIIDSVLHNS